MTAPLQNLDLKQAESLPSLKIYLDKCQGQALKDGKVFASDQAMVANRTPGDGHFEILGSNPESDYFCSAQVNWLNHEMLIDSGKLTTKERKPVGALWMSDACSMTRTLAGDAELAGKPCTDGQIDPRMAAVASTDSVQFFLKECNQLLATQGLRYGADWNGQVMPGRVFLDNPVNGDGVYSLKFASGAYNFLCEGRIDTLDHSMSIGSAPANKPDQLKFAKSEELTDDCTITRKTLGAGELVGECQDRSKRERGIESGLETAWRVLMGGLMARDVYQFIRKRPTLLGKAWRAVRHPVATASKIADSARSAGTYLRGVPAGAVRLAGALRAFGNLNAASIFGRGAVVAAEGGAVTAGGAGTGAAAGGGAVATAGVGATLGVAAVGLAIGIGVGVLIENVPRWLGAKHSVSDGIAWGIDGTVGLAACAMATVTGEKTEDVKRRFTQTNIEVLDHMGFGGWNVFKQSWGI